MHADFWQARWAQQQLGWHQDEINPYLQRFWSELSVAKHAQVFVPLCGKSLDMRWLHEQGHGVLGVELSNEALESFLIDQDLPVHSDIQSAFHRYQVDQYQLLCGDFFALSAEDMSAVGAVFDRASLVAFPPDMRARYATHLQAIVPKQAEILLVTMSYAQSDMQGPPFSVPEEEVHRLFADQFQIERMFSTDILEQEPQFKARGLNALSEQVYHLKRHP